MIAERVYGSVTRLRISHRVEPSATAASLSEGGTALNTSRATAEMNGMIMIPSTIDAVSSPMPIGGPEKSAPITGNDPDARSATARHARP